MTTFYVADHEGSVLLSCRSSLELDLIRGRPRISSSAPRSTVITSKVDHPKHTKKYEKIPQPASQKNKQEKLIPAPRQSKLYETTAKPMPLKRQVPAPRRSLKKEVIHNNLKPGNEVIRHNTKPANEVISDNQSRQEMDQVSMECKIPKKLVTQKEHIMDQYPDVFEGIGQFPGEPYHIQIDPKVPPKQTPCRMIPIHQKELFKKKLDKMVAAGILKPVDDSQPWINSFVIIESKDKLGKPKLRFCLDPTNLNKAVICEPYCFKTPEGIAHLLSNAVVLTTSDCNRGFWHQLLDEESSFLTTFNTEFG